MADPFKSDEAFPDLAFLPNGGLNAPYLLSNANLLLKAREFDAALALFRRLKDDPKWAYCAAFGIGQCRLGRGEPQRALESLEYAWSLAPKPFIALSIVETLLVLNRWDEAQSRARSYAQSFVSDQAVVSQFRDLYQRSLAEGRDSDLRS